MDEKRLAELQALADAAPTMRAPVLLDEIADASYVPTRVGDLLLRGSPDPEEPAEAEVHALMRFIAAARTAVPELVAEVRRLRDNLEASAPVNHVRAEALREARRTERALCVRFLRAAAGVGDSVMSDTWANAVADEMLALPD
jgi:hypothetical protein